MKFSEIATVCEGRLIQHAVDQEIKILFTDSRKAYQAPGTVFFAIPGARSDGHTFIRELYSKGIRHFVVEHYDYDDLSDASFFVASNTIAALQALAIHHRNQFSLPVIGITGSNGKTIVKEWLYQLLSEERFVIKNPGSYNSQIGVPLSVWQIRSGHELGIFEAGISMPNEMENLEAIIQPTIGIITNLGSAHDEGFATRKQKLSEKFKLFRNCKVLIYPADDPTIAAEVPQNIKLFSWGTTPDATLSYTILDGDRLEINTKSESYIGKLPFTEESSIQNALTCLATLLALGYKLDHAFEKLIRLRAIPMRLELKEAINQSYIIDDTYNNDLGGLAISLEFLQHQLQFTKRTVILSDILQTGLADKDWLFQVKDLLTRAGIKRLIAIGPGFNTNKDLFEIPTECYSTTEQFLESFNPEGLNQEIILIKGARQFRFERIVALLQQKLHRTTLEIDLDAMVRNLNYFKSILKPKVKLMVMVKALAYGSGIREVASLLQFHHVDYLGVAYPDEGVELRRNHISTPVMVMNPEADSFENLIKYNLEPEIYGFPLLEKYLRFLDGQPATIHLKLDTGMHRLGFHQEEVERLSQRLEENRHVRVASIFSHLSAADEASQDTYTFEQVRKFEAMCQQISTKLGYTPFRHLLNSPGILRFPDFQFEMVRLGIGLYGIDPTGAQNQALIPVASLKTIVSQIHELPAGSTVGYGRHGFVTTDSRIGTIAIGYADGYSRAFSKGIGKVWINGNLVPTIGNVCMDMTMVDLTGTAIGEGAEVELFGKNLPLSEVATWIGTIPYEILTQVSERVKRVYVTESF